MSACGDNSLLRELEYIECCKRVFVLFGAEIEQELYNTKYQIAASKYLTRIGLTWWIIHSYGPFTLDESRL